VCVSTGNQRFGVETKTRLATRQSSCTKRRWSRRPPTCSTTAFEKATSNAPSGNGSSRPSAVTVSTCGNSCAKCGSGTSLTAVMRSGQGYIASKKLWLAATPGSVAKPVSPAPTSSTRVSDVGEIARRKSSIFLARFQSETLAASRPIGGAELTDV